MLECPASSANTRTLTPLLASAVMKVRYAHVANHRLQQAVSLIDKAYE